MRRGSRSGSRGAPTDNGLNGLLVGVGLAAFPELSFVSQFYNEEFYLKGFEEKGNAHDFKEYDHVLFSFHGLPERHVDKVYKDGLCKDNDCEHGINDENVFCYKATCYETAIQLAKRFKLKEEDYT